MIASLRAAQPHRHGGPATHPQGKSKMLNLFLNQTFVRSVGNRPIVIEVGNDRRGVAMPAAVVRVRSVLEPGWSLSQQTCGPPPATST